MKIAVLNGSLDELKGNADVYGRGTGSNIRAAIARAVEDMLRSPKVRGKKLHSTGSRIPKMTFRGTITVTEGMDIEVDALASMPDEHIDTSDIPEVKDWSKAVRGKFYRGKK